MMRRMTNNSTAKCSRSECKEKTRERREQRKKSEGREKKRERGRGGGKEGGEKKNLIIRRKTTRIMGRNALRRIL